MDPRRFNTNMNSNMTFNMNSNINSNMNPNMNSNMNPNMNEQRPYYDSSLKRFVPNDMYDSLKEHNFNLEKINEDLYDRIKKCEELGLYEFDNMKQRIRSEIEKLNLMTAEIEKDMSQLDVYVEWDNSEENICEISSNEDRSFLIEQEGNDNSCIEMTTSFDQKSISKKKVCSGKDIKENDQPIVKKAKKAKSPDNRKSGGESGIRIEEQFRGIPINESVLRCKKCELKDFNIFNKLFNKDIIEKFAKELHAADKLATHEIIPTTSFGSANIDASNIKSESLSDMLLTRSRKELQGKSKDVSFYHSLRCQVCSSCSWMQEDMDSGVILQTVDDS